MTSLASCSMTLVTEVPGLSGSLETIAIGALSFLAASRGWVLHERASSATADRFGRALHGPVW